jgi:hypothetical protein
MAAGLLAATGINLTKTSKPVPQVLSADFGYVGAQTLDAQTVAAVARGERLSLAGAQQLLRRERVLLAKSKIIQPQLRADVTGGSWIDRGTGKLVVAITKRDVAVGVGDPDIERRVVARSLVQLGSLKAKVGDAVKRYRPGDVSWVVDEPGNVVTVEVSRASLHQADTVGFLQAVRALGPGVVVTSRAGRLMLTDGIEDGDEIKGDQPDPPTCSAGWWVKDHSGADMVMTAGHCMTVGRVVFWKHNGTRFGIDRSFMFGPSDWGLIKVDDGAGQLPTTRVNLYNGSYALVSGLSTAPIGATVCKSGTTTGQTCGPIVAYGESFVVNGKTLTGMTVADLCVDHGDSGSPVYQFDPDLAGHVLAQGILSGGEFPPGGGCSSRMWYTPIGDALSDSGTILGISSDASGGNDTRQPTHATVAAGDQTPSTPRNPTGAIPRQALAPARR